jgi:hypothetical protein
MASLSLCAHQQKRRSGLFLDSAEHFVCSSSIVLNGEVGPPGHFYERGISTLCPPVRPTGLKQR